MRTTKTSSTKQMPILMAQRIVRRYIRYGLVGHAKQDSDGMTREHALKQQQRIDARLDSALRRLASNA